MASPSVRSSAASMPSIEVPLIRPMIQRGCIQAGWERTGWFDTGWDKRGTLRPGWRAGRIGTCMLDHRAPFRTDQTIRPVMTERSDEHTSELQSLMRISYAVFCLKKKHKLNNNDKNEHT